MPSVEDEVGITEFVNIDCVGVRGILKQRYSDFIVREVTTEGTVLVLHDLSGKDLEERVFPADVSNEEDSGLDGREAADATLQALSSAYNTSGRSLTASEVESLSAFIIACHEKSPDCPQEWVGLEANDKALRSALHQAVKPHSAKFIDSSTVTVAPPASESSSAAAAGLTISKIRLVPNHIKTKTKGGDKGYSNTFNNGNNRKRKFEGWPDGLGDYLQFTLLKVSSSSSPYFSDFLRYLLAPMVYSDSSGKHRYNDGREHDKPPITLKPEQHLLQRLKGQTCSYHPARNRVSQEAFRLQAH